MPNRLKKMNGEENDHDNPRMQGRNGSRTSNERIKADDGRIS
jgi:hypothetical protein